MQGAIIALILAGAMNFIGCWFSDKIVLRNYHAHEVGPEDKSDLYRIVLELAQNARLPMPKVFVIPQPAPNALVKIHEGIKINPLAGGNPAHSHLFIINPFIGGLQRLFSTHPPVEERIRRLVAMEAQIGLNRA